MTSAPVRDPLADHLLTPQNAALLLMSLRSHATTVSIGLGRRRWLILGVIGIAQLMVVLDGCVRVL